VVTAGALTPPWSSQDGFAYRFDWGLPGLAAIGPGAGVVVVIDVLRFTTTVEIAVTRGASVVPVEPDGEAPGDALPLSPAVLPPLLHGRRCALSSTNGARVACAAVALGSAVLAGSLRNATAVATAARAIARSGPVAVVAAGERWPDGSLRPCAEDLLGAGAVLAALDPSGSISGPRCSPEAGVARAAFAWERFRIRDAIADTASARELTALGSADDLRWAGALDVSEVVPEWRDGAFRPR
jgi:2-phosphosulfolactate phosphatase